MFSNPGELRVAVDRYMTNQSEEVIAEYDSISDWNVSLVDDMSGTSLSCVRYGCSVSYSMAAHLIILFPHATQSTMPGLFQRYPDFNENISLWQTGNVMDMSRMFL